MIPNHNPGVRALYVTKKNQPYTLPVIGWDPQDLAAYVPGEDGLAVRASSHEDFRKLERDVQGINTRDQALSKAIEGNLEPVKVTTVGAANLEVPEDHRPTPTPSE